MREIFFVREAFFMKKMSARESIEREDFHKEGEDFRFYASFTLRILQTPWGGLDLKIRKSEDLFAQNQ